MVPRLGEPTVAHVVAARAGLGAVASTRARDGDDEES